MHQKHNYLPNLRERENRKETDLLVEFSVKRANPTGGLFMNMGTGNR